MSSSINPQNNRDLNQGICTSSPNLVVLAWTGDELSLGQAQNGVNCDFEVKFDLEVQGQLPPTTIGILTKVFYIYGPNLVILAETGDELSRGQARDWHTDGHTHTQTQVTTIPEGQYWSRVKTEGIWHLWTDNIATSHRECHIKLAKYHGSANMCTKSGINLQINLSFSDRDFLCQNERPHYMMKREYVEMSSMNKKAVT